MLWLVAPFIPGDTENVHFGRAVGIESPYRRNGSHMVCIVATVPQQFGSRVDSLLDRQGIEYTSLWVHEPTRVMISIEAYKLDDVKRAQRLIRRDAKAHGYSRLVTWHL
jgi:hypothetical protein